MDGAGAIRVSPTEQKGGDVSDPNIETRGANHAHFVFEGEDESNVLRKRIADLESALKCSESIREDYNLEALEVTKKLEVAQERIKGLEKALREALDQVDYMVDLVTPETAQAIVEMMGKWNATLDGPAGKEKEETR